MVSQKWISHIVQFQANSSVSLLDIPGPLPARRRLRELAHPQRGVPRLRQGRGVLGRGQGAWAQKKSVIFFYFSCEMHSYTNRFQEISPFDGPFEDMSGHSGGTTCTRDEDGRVCEMIPIKIYRFPIFFKKKQGEKIAKKKKERISIFFS